VQNKTFDLSRMLCLTLLVTLSGCATIGGNDDPQAVLIQSDPPGASILIDGQDRGKTPRFVVMPRAYRPRFNLEWHGKTTPVELDTHYRWTKSFWSNLIFLQLAPIGWLTDMLTGGAWEAKDPNIIDLDKSDGRAKATSRPPKTVAIAPPQADSIGIADAGAQALEETLNRGRNGFKVLPYRDTLTTFVGHQYDYDGAPEKQEDRRVLYYKLGADAI
jgi:hypothetical protein